MAGIEFNDTASNAFIGGTAANLQLGLPTGGAAAATPQTPPEVAGILDAQRQQRQSVYAPTPTTQGPSGQVGYNPATGDVFSDGNIFNVNDTIPIVEAFKAGKLSGNTAPLPPGFNRASAKDIAAYVQGTINDPGLVTTLKRSGAQMAGGIGEIAGDVSGNPDNALSHWSNNVIARNPSGINSFEDIGNNPGLAVREAAGQLVGFLGPQAGLRGVGAGLQALKFARAGQALGGFAAQAGVAGLPSIQGIGADQRENGVDGEWWAKPAKYAGAAAVGAIEQRFGPQDLLNRAMKGTLVKELGATPWRTVGRLTAQGTLGEAGEELVQNPIEQMAAGEDPTTAKNLRETAFGGAMGAIGGAIGGGAFGGLYGYGQHRRDIADALAKGEQADLLKRSQQEGQTADLFGGPAAFAPQQQQERFDFGSTVPEDPNQMSMFDFHGYVRPEADQMPVMRPIETTNTIPAGQQEQNWFDSMPEQRGRPVAPDHRAGLFTEANPDLQNVGTNPFTPSLFGTTGDGSFGAGDNQRAQPVQPEPHVQSFEAYNDFTRAALNGDQQGQQQATEQAAALPEHQQPYNPDQGVLPLQNDSNRVHWKQRAMDAFNKARPKGGKTAGARKVAQESANEAVAARAIRKLAFMANSGGMVDAYDAMHKAITGMSFAEFESKFGTGEETRDKLLENLSDVEIDTLARVFGWGYYDKAVSNVGIANDRNVTEETVNNTVKRLVTKLKAKAEALGIGEDEFRRIMGAHVGSNALNMEASDEQMGELRNSVGAGQDTEAADLAEVAQNALQTNATLGASEVGTKKGETLFNRVAPDGRKWEELTDLEKQHVTALSKSVAETPEGEASKSVTRSEVKKQVRESVTEVAKAPVGDYGKAEPTPNRGGKVELPDIVAENNDLTKGVVTPLEEAVRKDADAEDIADAKEEWAATGIESDPKWDELSLEEQTMWVNNFVAYRNREIGSTRTDLKKGDMVYERETKSGAPARTAATKQADAPTTAVKEAFDRATKEAQRVAAEKRDAERRSKPQRIYEDLVKRATELFNTLRNNKVRFSQLAAIDKMGISFEAKSLRVNQLIEGATKLVRKREGGPAEPLSLDIVRLAVSNALAGMKNRPEVRVVKDHTEAPSVLNEGDKGAFVILENGKSVVYVNAAAASSKADVFATVFHEILGHYGLSAKFGRELDELLNTIYFGNKAVRDSANAYMRKNGLKSNPENRALAVEEALAEGATMRIDNSVWGRLKALVSKYLRKIGITASVSNEEVIEILAQARAAVYEKSGDLSGERVASVKKREADAEEFNPDSVPKAAVAGTEVLGALRRGFLALREKAQLVREFGDKLTTTNDNGDEEGLAKLATLERLQGSRAKEILDRVRPTVDLWNTLPEADSAKVTTLLNESTIRGFALNEKIDSERNAWIDATIKDADSDEKAEALATRAKFVELKREYDSAAADVRKVYDQVDKVTTSMLKDQVALSVGTLMDTYKSELEAMLKPEQKAAFAKLKFDKHSTTDELGKLRVALRELFKGDRHALSAITEFNREVYDRLEGLHQRRGVYMPLMRFGDWVVVARSKEFLAKEKAVDELKKTLNEIRNTNPEFLKKAELTNTALEARVGAHRSKTAQEAYRTAKKAVTEFKRSDVFKAASKEAAAVTTELKKASKELSKMAKSKDHFNVHRYEKELVAEKHAKWYKAAGMESYAKHVDAWVGEMDTVSTSFSKKLTEKLQKRIVGEDDQSKALRTSVANSIKRIFTETQHDQSSLYRMAMRRSIQGFSKDGKRVFQSFSMQGAHRLAAQEFFIPVQEQLDKVRELAAQNDKETSGKLTEVANELAYRRHLDLEYKETPFQDAVARFNQMMVLGTSPAYLLQQLAQPFMLSVPFLTGRYGTVGGSVSQMWKGLRDARTIIADSGKGSGFMQPFEINTNHKSLKENERDMLKYVSDLGQLDILMDHDISLGAQGKASNKYDRFLEMSSWAARQIETTNRISTALAAYRMAYDNLIAKGETAAKAHDAAKAYAAEAVEQTQVDYSNENAARWMKRNAFAGSKLLMQFKKYQVHMIQMLLWNAKLAAKGDKEAMRILTGIMTTHMLMAGSLGLPVAAPIFTVAQIASWMGADDDETDPETAYKNFLADVMGKDVADVFARGLPTVLGADLSRKLGLGSVFSPVPFVQTKREGREQFQDMLLSLMGPSVGTAGRLVEGASKLTDGKFLDAWTAMAPKYVSDPLKAFKMAEEGVATKQGNVRIPAEKLSVADVIMAGMGVPTVKLNKYYEYSAEFEDQKAAASRVAGELKKQWVKGDAEDKASTMEAIAAYNERHPDAKITMKDLFAAKKTDARYQRGVTPEGLHVGKKEKEFAENLRF